SSPYRGCATHGWVLNVQGQAMSKSLGTGVDPNDLVKSHGADILRLWSSSIEFTDETRISEEVLARLKDAYFKLRNTFRYLLGNLYVSDPEGVAVAPAEMLEIDQWVLARAEPLVADCRRCYAEFAFHKVHPAVVGFAPVELSSLYFAVLKDRLYTA